jgi:hypothetical protein
MKESQENQQNAETQRERYYATIHKVALQANAGAPDKIPGECRVMGRAAVARSRPSRPI